MPSLFWRLPVSPVPKLLVRTRPLLAVWAGLLAAGCGQPPLSSTPPTPGAPQLTVMTYNVEFHSAGEPTTLDAIGADDADVIAMQEITPEMADLIGAKYAGLYPHQLFAPAGGTDGLAVISRYELVDRGLHPSPGGWHPAWHVDVDVPGIPLQLLNVHLRSLLTGNSGALQSYSSTEADHVLEIDDLSSQCETGRSNLVVGDFNEGPDGDAVGVLEGEGYANALPAFHPGQPTWRYRSVAGQLEETVDHILYDETLRPLNAWVEGKGRSDHLPVLAHFEPRFWQSEPSGD
jgi:endonuclease/exonuclease/phosphatase (EEP) superfamily protein YafD